MREITTVEPKDQQLMVALRIRPLNDAELEEGATPIAHKVGDQMVVLMDPGEDPEDTLRTHRSREKTFIFDTVFDQHASQEDVYCATTQHLVEGVISGYNATVFAYGPSGAGKTYTMLGMDAEPGIYLQTLRDLFQAIEETSDNMDYSVSMSYLEIYNEVIRDLLNPSSGFLDLREDSRGSIQIAGITEVSTSNAQEIMELLTKGNRQRTQEPTATNRTSSRSHAVLQVTVRQWSRGSELAEAVRIGRLFMVDLAGSERASQIDHAQEETFCVHAWGRRPDWEREKPHHAHREQPELNRDEEPLETNMEGDDGESAEPHEVALAREEINMLLAEQRRTAALKAGLEQRLANTKKKASQMEKLLPEQVISEDQREVLRLLCHAHELEVENTELQANNLYRKNLLCQKDFVIQRYHQHRLLCEQIIQGQRQLIQDGGLPVPDSLDKQYRLYSQELGEGTLNRLLLLHSLMAGALRDGSVLNISPPPEDSSRDQPDDRKDLPWGAPFELPPMLLETESDGHRSSKATPSKKLGKQDSLLPPSSLRILLTPPIHEKPSSLRVKDLVSKLRLPAGLDPSAPRTAAEAGGPTLSPQALKEIAVSTKSIALIAATRRSKAQDREGSCSHSPRHVPEEGAHDFSNRKPSATPEPGPVGDRRRSHASPCRDSPMERKAQKKRSPSLTWGTQPAIEKLPPSSGEHLAESQPPSTLLTQPSKSGSCFFPAVPAATKIKPSLSLHTDESTLHVPEVSFTFPSAMWQGNTAPSRAPLLPRDIRGAQGILHGKKGKGQQCLCHLNVFSSPSAPSLLGTSLGNGSRSIDSGGRRHSPLPPSNPRKHQGSSAKRPRRPNDPYAYNRKSANAGERAGRQQALSPCGSLDPGHSDSALDFATPSLIR
ncbi:PREDICTED: kinesin-like protein KIF19-like [Chrysochloris asiatica]|uniref:Kinesin-like protein n=1 Tax=Chrysochloris asiatica TaxID=185453 RepID=A0A9B0TE71_CHRAS|nr:PREDICTED: kinesin-like protein KIF19-like [Chrysochloris asiatica]